MEVLFASSDWLGQGVRHFWGLNDKYGRKPVAHAASLVFLSRIGGSNGTTRTYFF